MSILRDVRAHLRAPRPPLAATALVFLSSMAMPGSTSAQDLEDAANAPGSPDLAVAVERVGSEGITLDGFLNEPSWKRGGSVTGFVQREPVEGIAAEEQTEVWVRVDDEALYVAARLYDSDPGGIARQLVRRDAEGQYDYFEVSIDPNLDRRTGYRFRVSAANQQRDVYLFEDRESDAAWSAVWESAVQFDSLGWTVEMRVPLSQIRYEAAAGARPWGVNFTRRRLATNEESQYRLVSRTQRGVVSQFARLDGVEVASAGRRVELRPYALSRAFLGTAEAGNPFQDGRDATARTGADVRYGLGSQFTLDATINPDFGQVEADPAVINLTANETFLEERRPFFVEDARVFDFTLTGRQNRLYYSRRMGRAPQGSSPGSAAFVDVPDGAGIVGAVKVTGRTQGGLSLGVLAATTQSESGRAFFDETGEIETFLAEPRTHFGVTRLQQDLNGGASTIGGILTGLHRELPQDGVFDFLPANAFSLGLDWEHQWNDREWAFFGFIAGSHVRGDSTAMIRLQRRSNHYYQRPDSRWLSMDSTATTMSGLDWRVNFERRRGEHWTGGIWAAQLTSGFEVNDLGFSSRQEVLDGGVRVSYREIAPGSLFRGYNLNFTTFHNWSHDALRDVWSAESWGRAHVAGSVNLRADAQLLNFWRINGNISLRPETMDRSATRGGPLMASPRSFDARLGFDTDRRRALSLGPNVSFQRGAQGSEARVSGGVDVQFRPNSRVEIALGPTWSRSENAAQFVTASGAVDFAPTFGSRYVFADLERTEFSVETRVDVAFSPELSLQFFAQPLLSSGDYSSYKQFLEPGTFRFETFGEGSHSLDGGVPTCAGGRTCVAEDGTRYVDFDGDGVVDDDFSNRSFNVRSLIGNAVLRWEYRPGSTVFLVWQRRQASEISNGDFAFRRDLSALLDAPADNIFMVKVNYWVGL